MPAESVLDSVAAFLLRRETPQPDGRPLYAYRASQSEVDALVRSLRQELPRLGPERPMHCAALCLVAAETFCREHASGSWSWDPLWAAIGDRLESQARFYAVLDRGLRWWERPLLRTEASRRFLTTLALEGGLPRRLLAAGARGGALGAYLARALRLHERYPDVDPVELAKQLQHDLPRTLRHAELFELIAALVQSIAGLRRRVRGVADPVVTLDAQRPGWRDELPLRFDDDGGTAETLVSGLLREPPAEKRPGSAPGIGLWLEVGEPMRLVRAPRFPPTMPASELWDGDPPPVIDVLLRSGAAGSALARRQEVFLGQAWRNERGDRYDLDRIAGETLPAGPSLLGEWILVSCAPGHGEQVRPLRGAEDIASVPWSFEPPGEDGRGRVAGIGSARTRSAALVVALPAGAVRTSPEWMPAGRLESCDRDLWSLRSSGEVRIEDERFTMRVGETGAEEYQLRGRLALLHASDGLAWSGPPRLRLRTDPEEPFIEVPAHEIQWRSGADGAWRSARHAMGRGLLRHRRDGITLYRTRLCILPQDLEVHAQRSSEGKVARRGAGDLVVSSRELLGLQASADPGIELSVRGEEGRFVVSAVRTGDRPARDDSLTLLAELQRGGAVELVAPLPAVFASFVDEQGNPPRSGTVTPRQLERMRAVLVGASTAHRPIVEIAPEDRPTEVLAVRRLPESLPGRFELPLRDFAELARHLLSIAGEGSQWDVGLRLRLHADGQEKARLTVRSYSLQLEPSLGDALLEERRIVVRCVPDRRGDPLDPGAFTAVALSTWRPWATPRELPRVEGGFELDRESLVPGWWVVLFNTPEDGVVVRPRAYQVPEGCPGSVADDELAPRGELELACRRPHGELDAALEQTLDALALGSEEEAILPLLRTMEVLLRVPAPTFRTCVAMTRRARVCARVSLELVGGDSIHATWLRLEELCFAWEAVPLAAWRAAAIAFARQAPDSARALLASGAVEKLESRFAPRRPFVKVLATNLRGVLELDHPADDASRLARISPDHAGLLRSLGQAHEQLRRDHAEEVERGDVHWPRLSLEEAAARLGITEPYRRLGLQEHLREVRPTVNAPALAAVCCALLPEIDQDVVRIIKRARAFDRDWFDHAFRIQLARAIAIHHA